MPRTSATAAQSQVLISTTTLAAASSTMSWTVPTGYKQLRLVLRLRSNFAGSTVQAWLQFNGDTVSHYEWAGMLYNNAGTVATGGSASTNVLQIHAAVPATSAATNVFTRCIVEIPDYTDTTTLAKQVMASAAAPSYPINLNYGNWIPTAPAAITSIVLGTNSASYIAGSAAWLYGIR